MMLTPTPGCRKLGQRVFSKPGAGAGAPAAEEPGWRESLYRVYKSGHQSMRVAIYGCKHDAALFEELLQVLARPLGGVVGRHGLR